MSVELVRKWWLHLVPFLKYSFKRQLYAAQQCIVAQHSCLCLTYLGDVLKATLATDAVIGATGSVHTPGSGYVLLHHVMGETDGERGIWSYVEGGMGSVSVAIGNAAKEAGALIVTSAEVQQLLIDDAGTVNGATTKINIEVDKLPQFKCCNLNHPDAGPQHVGTAPFILVPRVFKICKTAGCLLHPQGP